MLSDGLRAASRSPLVVAGLVVARGMAMVAWVAPLLVVYDTVSKALGDRGDVVAAVLALLSPATWLLAAGIFAACMVLSAALELLVWSGGLAVLDRAIRREARPSAVATFSAAFGPAFVRLAVVAACMCAASIAWSLFVWTLGGAAAWTLFAGSPAARVAAAAGLSLAAVVWLAGAVYLPILSDLSLARAGVLGERPLEAIHGAATGLARRPLTFAGIMFVVGAIVALVTAGLSGPAQAAALTGNATLLAIAVTAAQALSISVGSFASATRLGAFVSAARAG